MIGEMCARCSSLGTSSGSRDTMVPLRSAPCNGSMSALERRRNLNAIIPSVAREGATVRVIAGEAFGARGAASTLIPVRLLDVAIQADATFEIAVPDAHSVFAYLYEGAVAAADKTGESRNLEGGTLAVLEGSGGVRVIAGGAGAKVLYADALPIGEPIARYGPFVMNTREELVKAFDDYSKGELDRVSA